MNAVTGVLFFNLKKRRRAFTYNIITIRGLKEVAPFLIRHTKIIKVPIDFKSGAIKLMCLLKCRCSLV